MAHGHHGTGRVYKKGAPGSEYEDMNARRQSRRAVEKATGKKIPKGMQVDHHDDNPQNRSLSNLKVISKKANLAKEHGADAKKSKKGRYL